MALTADEIVDRSMRLWGIRLLYLLAGKVVVEFPATCRAYPSPTIRASLKVTPLFRDGDRQYFPFVEGTKVWHEQIIPLLRDPTLQLSVGVNKIRLQERQYEDLIRQYAGVVEARFKQAGLLPP